MQEQPSPPTLRLVNILTGESMNQNLMQDLEICLPTDLPTTEGHFSFQ